MELRNSLLYRSARDFLKEIAAKFAVLYVVSWGQGAEGGSKIARRRGREEQLCSHHDGGQSYTS